MRRFLVICFAAAGALLLFAASWPEAARANDYPTADRADYVLGCMAANGNTREALLKCSCAIDVIAGIMPYAQYEKAETALDWGALAGIKAPVTALLPPTHLSGPVAGQLLAGDAPPPLHVLWLAGYGGLAFALGLWLLRRRALGGS